MTATTNQIEMLEQPPVIELSVIVPLFDEEQNVTPLYTEITAVIDELPLQVEMIFVDDCSVDQTFARAKHLAESDDRLRVIRFRDNYGQTPALAAGIELARGDIAITMDGDLQNDPRDIPRLLEKLAEGYDIVVGWRSDRQDSLVLRTIPSKMANWLIGKVTGNRIRDNGCSLRAYRMQFVKQLPLYSEMHRLIPAIAAIAGPRIAEIKVRHASRKYGESKYGLSRTYKVLLDLIVVRTIRGFASRPLRSFLVIATPFILLSPLLLVGGAMAMAVGSSAALTLTGVGLFYSALGFFLLFSGGLGELIVKTADKGANRFFLSATSELSPRELRQ